MIHYHEVEQCSEEWFELRKRKLTGSNATAIGANGAGLITYCRQLAIEVVGVKKEHYTNADIERGKEYESIACSAYELEKGVIVNHVGFITNDDFNNVGISPDGLVGLDGGIEIKAKNNEKHFALITGDEKEIPDNQIQMTLFVTGRKWWDFVSYNPNFSKPLFIKRIYPDPKYFEKLKLGFANGNKLIDEYIKLYNKF